MKEYTQGRVIVSSSDIREEQRKPNEQHYEVALKRTGFNSDNTIVVEDSPI
ncbi:HAD hydrolase-like protein [bacterium]|nr:HAD hydrolase-like protein [bacterium]